MTEQIEKMRYWHNRMTTILNELEALETKELPAYDRLTKQYSGIVHTLENRREMIQRRKYQR